MAEGYGNDAGFDAWLTANGYTLPVGSLAQAVLRLRGSNYIDALYSMRFSGVPTDGVTQERQWPRTGATAYGSSIPDTLIPTPVVEAAYYAAYAEALSPGSLSVTVTPGRLVKRQKVDTIEREFFAPGDNVLASMTPVLSAIEGLLAPYFKIETAADPWLAVI